MSDTDSTAAPASSTRASDDDDSRGRIWQGIKSLLFRKNNESTLREQLEDFIDEHEGESGSGSPTSNGDLTAQELEMLRNLLHFSEHNAGDVGVPRADIIGIEEKAKFIDLVALFVEHGHSRVPVYRGHLDEIIGMVHIKDVFAALAAKGRNPSGITDFIRQPLYVPESMGVLELLEEMRKSQLHLAIVLDEYSGTEGLITIEDLIEEIFGEIADEHDDAPIAMILPIEHDGRACWRIDARAELDDVAAAVGDERLAEIDEDIDTIGGLAVVLAGHVPQVGEVMESEEGWRLEVLEGDEKRVALIRLHPPIGMIDVAAESL